MLTQPASIRQGRWRQVRAGDGRALEVVTGGQPGGMPLVFLPADQLASVTMAVTYGLAMQMLLAPELVDPSTLGVALTQLVPLGDGAGPGIETSNRGRAASRGSRRPVEQGDSPSVAGRSSVVSERRARGGAR